MFLTTASFKRRLFFTGISLFTIIILAATALFLATRQYSYYLERSSHAQQIYSSYLAVSDHTYRKLSAMGEIVTDGYVIDLEERYQNQQALRDALQKVFNIIDTEFTFIDVASKTKELDHFNKIEKIAEQIISGSQVVRTAVEADERSVAKQALEQLRSEEIEGEFNRLIDQAIKEEQREVRETELAAIKLSTLLTNWLPFLAVFFLILGAMLIYTTWAALIKSLKVLKSATDSYRSGDFNHRIGLLEDAEFSDLADALNHMAATVTSQRDRERESHDNLESLVSVRTRELENSNTKLETISEARKQFLADISHELRTPLTIIQGESDLALRGEPKTPDQYIDALSRVREQTLHTTKLVQDLLFVARTEDGKAPMHLSTVAMGSLVVDICDDFRVLAAQRYIEIIESDIDDRLMVNLDVGRIKQVVTILLDNAIRYSHENSTIKVSVTQLDKQAILTVVDNGIGLNSGESSQIFSRFYRGSEGAAAATGTGLGLPVAKAIVDAHGGSIWLQGKKGRGTTATVMLPLEDQME